MKKYILSAFVCLNLSLNAVHAQQTFGYGQSNSINRSDKNFDTTKLTQKEISIEVNAGKSDIYLDNSTRTVEIKTWSQPKVKVTTKIFLDGKSALTDEQWFEKLNLTLKQSAGAVQINSRNIGSYSTGLTTVGYAWSSNSANNIAVFDGEGNNIGSLPNARRTITIFIPEGNKLEIENQYGNLLLSSNMQNVTLKTNNGSFEAGDITRLVVRAKYTPLVLGNVKDAEIEMTNARLRAGNIGKLDIDSKYTNVEIAAVNDIMIRSANDEYEIEEAGDVRGRKTYGNLRINTLKTGIDIEGANADIKVRNISTSAETINIHNKYADIRLPVNNLTNYDVKFNGTYNTVYAPFEKKPLADAPANTNDNEKPASARITQSYSRSYANGTTFLSASDASDSKGFTAAAGDVKGKHTKFIITCASCTVDFK